MASGRKAFIEEPGSPGAGPHQNVRGARLLPLTESQLKETPDAPPESGKAQTPASALIGEDNAGSRARSWHNPELPESIVTGCGAYRHGLEPSELSCDRHGSSILSATPLAILRAGDDGLVDVKGLSRFGTKGGQDSELRKKLSKAGPGLGVSVVICIASVS